MRSPVVFIIVGGFLASCIEISPTPKFKVVTFEQMKCVSAYETFLIKKCNYEQNKRLCYQDYLASMKNSIYEHCGVDITN